MYVYTTNINFMTCITKSHNKSNMHNIFFLTPVIYQFYRWQS